MNEQHQRHLYLCAGAQSGGTTLVSWCFLQRKDMDGVLDLKPDVLQPLPALDAPFAWAKATICGFRFEEIAAYYRWQGYTVHPLLVIRHPKQILASLSNKWYGINGTTAEDPPLRVRLMRFHDDWLRFREAGWPILRYESLVKEPEKVLRRACEQLELSWDEAMLTWPKSDADIADASLGSETFLRSLGNDSNATTAIKASLADCRYQLSEVESEWLAQHFSDYAREHDYLLDRLPPEVPRRDVMPQFDKTRRATWEAELNRARRNIGYLQRILRHPVLGSTIKLWTNLVNPSLREVFREMKDNELP